MRCLGSLALGACILGALVVATTAAQGRVKSSITVNAATGAILQSRNADASHAPASLNKMMTLYLVFEALSQRRIHWNTRVTLSRHAVARTPIRLNLRAGTRVSVRDLVYATALRSANDAAAALAEKIGGSERRFARLMTFRGQQLGMRRTVFRNASGLPASGQRTTARDMAVLASALIRHFPQYHQIFATRYYRFGRRTFRNTNRLLHSHPDVDGMKTGYTRRARFNLASSARRGRERLVTVVLGARTSDIRYRATSQLIASGWHRAQRMRAAGKRGIHKIHVASRSRVGGSLAQRQAKSKSVASLKVVNSSGQKRKIASVLAKQGSSRNEARSASASKPDAVGKLHGGQRTKRVTRYVKRRVVKYQQSHGVQVGAFYNQRRARLAIRQARQRLSRHDRSRARTSIKRRLTRGRSVYIARLMGYRANQARRVCGSLRRRGIECIAVSARIPVTRTVSQRVVVTSAMHTERRDRSKRRRSVSPGKSAYAIQVGAFSKYKMARKGLNRAQKALPHRFTRGKNTRILARRKNSNNALYRARITGMSRAEAHKACHILKKRSLRCLAVKVLANS